MPRHKFLPTLQHSSVKHQPQIIARSKAGPLSATISLAIKLQKAGKRFKSCRYLRPQQAVKVRVYATQEQGQTDLHFQSFVCCSSDVLKTVDHSSTFV